MVLTKVVPSAEKIFISICNQTALAKPMGLMRPI